MDDQDEAGKVVYCNRSFEAVFARTNCEMAGATLFELLGELSDR
jgi:PAS domain-containing protein